MNVCEREEKKSNSHLYIYTIQYYIIIAIHASHLSVQQTFKGERHTS